MENDQSRMPAEDSIYGYDSNATRMQFSRCNFNLRSAGDPYGMGSMRSSNSEGYLAGGAGGHMGAEMSELQGAVIDHQDK